MAAPYVDDGAGNGVDGGPGVVVEKVGELVAFSAGYGDHCAAHSFCSEGVFAEGGEHGLDVCGVVCEAESGLGGFRGGGVEF